MVEVTRVRTNRGEPLVRFCLCLLAGVVTFSALRWLGTRVVDWLDGDTDYRAYGFFVEPVVFALLVYPRLLGSPLWVGLASALVSGLLAWPEIEAISVRALFLILAACLLSATLSFAVASLARRNP